MSEKVTQKEVDKLVEFIVERASRTGLRKVSIPHRDLFSILAEKNQNRIRWMMKSQLSDAGIKFLPLMALA